MHVCKILARPFGQLFRAIIARKITYFRSQKFAKNCGSLIYLSACGVDRRRRCKNFAILASSTTKFCLLREKK